MCRLRGLGIHTYVRFKPKCARGYIFTYYFIFKYNLKCKYSVKRNE